MVLQLPKTQSAILLGFPPSGKGARTVRVAEVGMPGSLGPNEVLVQSGANGICGTDDELKDSDGHGGIVTKPEFQVDLVGEFDQILGHENWGVVVDVGDDVTELRPGDCVVPVVRCECGVGSCKPCSVGRWDNCISWQFTESGIGGQHGYLCQYYKRNARHLVKVSRALGVKAVATEPFSVGAKAVEDAVRLFTEATMGLAPRNALVMGIGSVGYGIQAELLRLGIPTVGTARSPLISPKADLFNALGRMFNTKVFYIPVGEGELPLSEVNAHLAERDPDLFGHFRNPKLGFDLIFDVSGDSAAAFNGIALAGPCCAYGLGSVTGGSKSVLIPGDALNLRACLGNFRIFGFVNNGKHHFERAAATLLEIDRLDPTWLHRLQSDGRVNGLEEGVKLIGTKRKALKTTVIIDEELCV